MSDNQQDNEKISPIEGWIVHPKIAKYLVAFCIFNGLLGLFSTELGLPNLIKHLTFTLSVICMCAFVLPQANIWQRTTKK
jgi:heme A synthase